MTQIDYEALAKYVLEELWRFDLTKYEREIAQRLVAWTYWRGRDSVRIPRDNLFCEVTFLSKSKVSDVLRALQKKRIVQIGPEREFRILPDSHFWQRADFLDRGAIEAAEKVLVDFNGQGRLGLAHEKTVHDAIAEVSLAAAAARETRNQFPPAREAQASDRGAKPGQDAAHGYRGNGEPEGSIEVIARVPDSGTEAGVPDSGTEAGVPDSGTEAGVPDSGTEAGVQINVKRLNVQRLSASSKKRLNDERLTGVPESGTISAEAERELFNRLATFLGVVGEADDLAYWGGKWRLRIREAPAVFERALSDCECKFREGEIKRNWPAYLTDLFNRFL